MISVKSLHCGGTDTVCVVFVRLPRGTPPCFAFSVFSKIRKGIFFFFVRSWTQFYKSPVSKIMVFIYISRLLDKVLDFLGCAIRSTEHWKDQETEFLVRTIRRERFVLSAPYIQLLILIMVIFVRPVQISQNIQAYCCQKKYLMITN